MSGFGSREFFNFWIRIQGVFQFLDPDPRSSSISRFGSKEFFDFWIRNLKKLFNVWIRIQGFFQYWIRIWGVFQCLNPDPRSFKWLGPDEKELLNVWNRIRGVLQVYTRIWGVFLDPDPCGWKRLRTYSLDLLVEVGTVMCSSLIWRFKSIFRNGSFSIIHFVHTIIHTYIL